MVFTIRVAKSAGFCFGVRRALDKILHIINTSKTPVRTLGPLIHNEQVLNVLKRRGASELHDDEDLAGKCVVIRAHGITPEKYQTLSESKAIICNATCAKVAQVQSLVKKAASEHYRIAIVGDPGHAEVVGLLGYAGAQGIVVPDPESAQTIPPGDKICIVAQTTQNRDNFDRVTEILRTRFKETKIFDTICDATSERQIETLQLANWADLMIVIGSERSANTQRLVDIASAQTRTILIQTPDTLNPEMFANVQKVGVTAGASTPVWLISAIVEKIQDIGWKTSAGWIRPIYRMVAFFHHSKLLFASSISALSIGIASILSIPYSPVVALLSFWFGLFWQWIKLLDDERYGSLFTGRTEKHAMIRSIILICLIIMITGGALYFAVHLDFVTALLILFVCYLCCAYIVPSFPFFVLPNKTDKYRRFFPFYRDILFGISMGIVTVIIPCVYGNTFSVKALLMFFYVMFMGWMRMILIDMHHIQSDLLAGRVSLPIVLEERRMLQLVTMAMVVWIALMLIPAIWFPANSPPVSLVTIPVFWGVYLLVHRNRRMIFGLASELSLDGGIWLGALVGLLSHID